MGLDIAADPVDKRQTKKEAKLGDFRKWVICVTLASFWLGLGL